MKTMVRLSQCMIVKNEEKNIRRALTWGKDIAFEQIVVDTGSTDNTVEIAEEMGAKIYHFQWVDDFSAAKNFAIQKATGNWIAFLDADEYFETEDSKKIIPLITRLEQNSVPAQKPIVIRTALANLNDDGGLDSVGAQDRIFCKNSGLHYRNRIHEMLYLPDEAIVRTFDATNSLTIYHTGYTKKVYSETKKMSRNIFLLEQEVSDKPEDYNAWSYLGDALFGDGQIERAEEVYNRVIENMCSETIEDRKNAAFCNLLKIKYMKSIDDQNEVLSIYEKSIEYNCSSPDIEYWTGCWMFSKGKVNQGIAYFELGLKKLESYQEYGTVDMTGGLLNVYQKLFEGYQSLKRVPESVKYGVLALRINPYKEDILTGLLRLFKNEPGEDALASATFSFLSKLYDFSSFKNKLFLIKVSKIVSFPALESQVYSLLSPEEQAFLKTSRQSLYRVSEEERQKEYPDFLCKNEMDQQFLSFIKEAREKSSDELLSQFLENWTDLKKDYQKAADNYLDCFSSFPLWGKFEPEKKQYEALIKRIEFVKTNFSDLVKLYDKLADYHSKKVLTSILKNWLFLDTNGLGSVKRELADYYDLDLVSTGENCVFVDAGAYSGDAALAYINAYGRNYKRIYCYEAYEKAVEPLKNNMEEYENVVIRPIGLSSGELQSRLILEEDQRLTGKHSDREKAITVKTTSIDLDITEKIDFLKIDVNGREKQVLQGVRNHMEKEHPSLLIALYHEMNHLLDIPQMITEVDSSYKLYLRYYGGDLIPTNYILYAV